ncbi:MAG: Trp family transcriptional regulator, partial [Patescibacteria group bacterium]
MPRFDYAALSMKERKAIIDPLVEALHGLKTKKELYEFLSRLLTASELIMIGRRLQAAEGLLQGKSYYTVREETGIGFSTIQSVDGWLKHVVRDYHEIRARQRRDEKWREQQRRNL